MPLITTQVIILQTHRYSDTSKILRLMTREHGPRSAIARGALRPKSRFGGVLESFAQGTATLFVKENRDLDSLSGFELLRERQALSKDLERFVGASVLCEVVLRLAPEHRDLLLYKALLEGLDCLVDAPKEQVQGLALQRIWHVVRVLGFGPDLETCVGCGRPISSGEEGWFDFPGGGLRCRQCAGGGRYLDPTEVASLRCVMDAEQESLPLGGGQGGLLADFIQYHMAEGMRLRSLPFLRRLG